MDLRVEVQAATPRRLWALTRSLPPDSAWQRNGKQWSQSDELAAIAIERGDSWLRVLAIGQGRKVENVPPLPRIEHPDRPGSAEGEARKRMSSAPEIKSFMDRLRR
jgi:hypothetical protein